MKKLNNFHEQKITDKYIKAKEGGKGEEEGESSGHAFSNGRKFGALFKTCPI